MLAPGSQIAGYRIDSMVGRGGMGVVYRAFQVGLERVVALKVIAPELLDDADVRERFLAEARAAASVDHPNVIPVHEAGAADGVAFIAMRFVGGSDLRSLVRGGGPLDAAEAAGYVAQAGAALDAIHAAGFVHRDVKPANLLIDAGGHVYLSDFGLAKQVLTRSDGTATGQWVGTLDYVAPEQIRGEKPDARADVYALGGVLHFALTGRVPYERDGDEAKLWAQLSAPPPVPSALRPGLPEALDAVVARAMAKRPEERFPSAGDLARAARAAAAGTTATEPERSVARGAAAPLVEYSTRTAARPRRRRAWVVGAVAAALAVAGVTVALAMRGEDDPPPRARATPTPTATPPPFTATTTERIGDRPNAIARVGDVLWIASANSEWLTLVSAESGKELDDHVRVGPDVRALVADRDDLWLARGSTKEVIRVDAGTRRIVAELGVPGTPTSLAVASSGIWVGVTGDDGRATLLRYDRGSGALEQSIAVREGIGGIAVGGGAVWVVKAATSKLSRVSGDRLTDWASVPGEVGSIRYGEGALWLTMPAEDAVAKVEARTGRSVVGAAGRAPAQAVVADGRVFVASRNDHTVVVLEPEALRSAGEPIAVGLNPYALATDGESVWVTGLADNTLTRIDPR
jgi:DNA-binding beta-propeller fold protein YncE